MEVMVDVKIKLLEGGIMPTKAHNDDAAWDCYAREEVVIKPSSYRDEDKVPAKLVPLGFCLELPKGYHAEIVSRSSVGYKTNLRMPNGVGVIDSNYRGEVQAMYELAGISFAHDDFGGETTPHTIHKGDRICQMLIVKDPEIRLVQVDELSDSDRGTGGFGSTGA